MNTELRDRMIAILEPLAEGASTHWSTDVFLGEEGVDEPDFHAGFALISAGHLKWFERPGLGGFYITLSGFAYLGELKHPWRMWMGQHWFTAIVASATIVLALASAAAQVWTAFS